MQAFSRRGWFRRASGAAVLLAFLPLASAGCFGKFQLTRNVYSYNQEVGANKWTRWLMFLVLSIVPFYAITMLLDSLIINAVEFWSGSNPVRVTEGTRRIVEMPDGSKLTMTLQADQSIAVRLRMVDGATQHFVLAREGESVVARNADGLVLARVADLGGIPAVVERNAVATSR
jgi:hypothetical protein